MSSRADDYIAGDVVGRDICDRIRGDTEHPDALYELMIRAFAHGPGDYPRGLVRAVQKEIEKGAAT